MNTIGRRARALLVFGALAVIAGGCSPASAPGPASALGTLAIKEIGSLHVGGGNVTLTGLPGGASSAYDPNGDFEAGQMYVQYVKLAAPRAKYPLLFVHGGGLTGVTWETKPDGQPGWEMFFLKAGHDVYVGDGMERGRASWARFPEIYKTAPTFVNKKVAWETFRIGPLDSYRSDPAERQALPGVLFPTQQFDQFIKQTVPIWGANGPEIQKAYDALVQTICPCVVILHSQGGSFGFNAARKAPDKIKAIVAIEPAGVLDPTSVDVSPLKAVPHLIVWGDYLELYPRWLEIEQRVARYEAALRDQGGVADRLDLPKAGIHGNSHMLMMDSNSDQVAELVQQWIEKQGLMN